MNRSFKLILTGFFFLLFGVGRSFAVSNDRVTPKSTLVSPQSVVVDYTLSICSGETLAYTPVGSDPTLTYTWGTPTVSPGSSVSVSAQNSPQFLVNPTLINTTSSVATVTYTVMVSDS